MRAMDKSATEAAFRSALIDAALASEYGAIIPSMKINGSRLSASSGGGMGFGELPVIFLMPQVGGR